MCTLHQLHLMKWLYTIIAMDEYEAREGLRLCYWSYEYYKCAFWITNYWWNVTFSDSTQLLLQMNRKQTEWMGYAAELDNHQWLGLWLLSLFCRCTWSKPRRWVMMPLTSTCDWCSLSMLVTAPLPANLRQSSSPPYRTTTLLLTSELHLQSLWWKCWCRRCCWFSFVSLLLLFFFMLIGIVGIVPMRLSIADTWHSFFRLLSLVGFFGGWGVGIQKKQNISILNFCCCCCSHFTKNAWDLKIYSVPSNSLEVS